MLILGLLALLLVVSVCSRLLARVRPGADEVEPAPGARQWPALRARRPALSLPEGHRPPAGLGPLSPSERFLSSEAARGIRALQVWLIDQDGAPA